MRADTQQWYTCAFKICCVLCRLFVASTEKLAKELLGCDLQYMKFDREYPDPCPL